MNQLYEIATRGYKLYETISMECQSQQWNGSTTYTRLLRGWLDQVERYLTADELLRFNNCPTSVYRNDGRSDFAICKIRDFMMDKLQCLDRLALQSRPELITAQQVCLRFCLTPQELMELCEKNVIPSPVRIGKLLRWRTQELDAWMSSGCH